MFSEYVNSAAFRIDLSKNMIAVLISMKTDSKKDRFNGGLNLSPYHALERRGLIEWRGDVEKRHGPYITKAGEKVFELLVLAGYVKYCEPVISARVVEEE